MLRFAVLPFFSTVWSLNYTAFVADVKNTFDECYGILEDAVDHVNAVHSLEVVHRRAEEDRLGACVSVLAAGDTYRDDLSRFELVQEFIHGSERIYLNSLLKPLSKKISLTPLYIASRDGDAASDFHSACDKKGPTVVIVESTSGPVFGLYSDVSWDSDGSWLKSSTSFLFRLRPSLKQYVTRNQPQEYAILNHGSYGPTAGNGHDLYISDNAMNNNASQTNGGLAYAVPTDARHELNDGEPNFQVKDYVVLTAVTL